MNWVNVNSKICINCSKHRSLGCDSSTPLCELMVTTGESLLESCCWCQNYGLEDSLANIFCLFLFFSKTVWHVFTHFVITFLIVFCIMFVSFSVSLLYRKGLAFLIPCEAMNKRHFMFLTEMGKENTGGCFILCQPFKKKKNKKCLVSRLLPFNLGTGVV